MFRCPILPLLLLCARLSYANVNVLIVYHSETNYTRSLAQAIGGGARDAKAAVRVQSIAETSVEADVLVWADVICIGSPVHYGNPSAAMLQWFETAWEAWWEDPRFAGKVGAVFSSGGGLAQGVEHVIASLQRLLTSFRIRLLTPDPTRSGYDSYGAVAVTGTPPFNMSDGAIATPFVQAGHALGELLAAAVVSSPPRPEWRSAVPHLDYSVSSRGV
jgi:flavodoxin